MIIEERTSVAKEKENERLEIKNKVRKLKNKGYSNKEIGKLEGISEATVRYYLQA